METIKKNNILLWGDLCIDRNNLQGKEVCGPGGSVYYSSKIFKNFNWNPFIISPRGKDYDDAWLGGVSIFPKTPFLDRTLVYQNRYDSNGKRTLYSENRDCASFINPSLLPPELINSAKAIVVCPIDNNVSLLNIKELIKVMGKETLLACLPQGFFRRYEEDGKVYQDEWENAEEIIPYLDLIFLSEEDGKDLDKKAEEWNRLGVIVVITRAEKGCSVFKDGERTDFAAFSVEKVIDPVGSGDVFSAAFIHSYLLDKDFKKAAIFANATAALSLSFHVQEIKIDIKRINNLISKGQKKQLN